MFSGLKYPRKHLFYFEKGSTGNNPKEGFYFVTVGVRLSICRTHELKQKHAQQAFAYIAQDIF